MSQLNTSQDMFDESSSPEKLSSQEVAWRGIPLTELYICCNFIDQYPPLIPSASHIISFKLPLSKGCKHKPYPEKTVDAWDNHHVRMPHSPKSVFPVSDELKPRWQLISKALKNPIFSSRDLENAIFSYNSSSNQRWSFNALHKFFGQTLDEGESEYFFESILPDIINLALSLPKKVTGALPLLQKHCNKSLSLTQDQVSSLIANAFFCTYPRRNFHSRSVSYPSINFNRLYQCGDLKNVQEKLKCFINYFRRVIAKTPEGIITLSRHYIEPNKLPKWETCDIVLPKLHISSTGTIEDEGKGFMEVDFANKFVGGGILGRGAVQEEIKFLICPELIISRLVTECLDDSEALIITGCERFNKYTGYGDSFSWVGDFVDSASCDKYGRKCTTVVAIDAVNYNSPKLQYKVSSMRRELNKAFTGFSFGSNSKWNINIATGNWGCGVFKGDPKLKALLQLMAAGAAKKHIAYFTFQNTELRDSVFDMYEFLIHHNVSIGQLWKILIGFDDYSSRNLNASLYDFIYAAVHKKGSLEKSFAEKEDQSKQISLERPNKMEEDIGLSEEEIAEALRCADAMETDVTNVCSKEPIPAETYSIKTEEGRRLGVEIDKQRWQAYKIAKQEMTPKDMKMNNDTNINNNSSSSSNSTPKTAVKRRITDYYGKSNK